MKVTNTKYTLTSILCLLVLFVSPYNLVANSVGEEEMPLGLSLSSDTLMVRGELPYPFEDSPRYSAPTKKDTLVIDLKDPSNIEKNVFYDPVSGEFIFYEKVGDFYYRIPRSMSMEEYVQYDIDQAVQRYWYEQSGLSPEEQQKRLIPQLKVNSEAFKKVFGSDVIDIRPQGYVELSFGIQTNNIDNPALSQRLRKTTTFDFDEKINMSVVGKIGENMEMRVNYNTEATFDFENKMKLDYNGQEDDIFKKIEAGNVSMQSDNSLIRGGTNLFGVRTEMQFGKLNVSTVLSQQKGETTVIETENGSVSNTFDIEAVDYDANRHFFLGHYFYDSFDQALSKLPIIQSSITINKIEVWVTNKSGNYTSSRNIIGFTDLGERGDNRQNTQLFSDTPGLIYPESVYPYNESNALYEEMTTTYSDIREISKVTQTLSPLSSSSFVSAREYEKIENARLLSSSEYTINYNLGFISLSSALNSDEVLAVAYQYTANGKVYQVGEFSTDGIDAPETIILKMLKGTNLNPEFKIWQLMMKNIYDLGTYQLSNEDFTLDIVYQDNTAGTELNYLPDGPLKEEILLDVMNLDNLNSQGDSYPDGQFDYVEGTTVISQGGKVIIPSVEPFGSNLEEQLKGNAAAINKYVFNELYDNTKIQAEQEAEKNKFSLRGSYKGSSNTEIPLNTLNVTPGSVTVMAGGRELVENVDYVVDYTLGRVKIINTGLLESGTPITVSTESQDLFSMQRKTLLGTQLNYQFNEKFNLGGTAMYLQEKPLTTKVNYGEDPISNTMLGLNASYKSESQLITNLVDKIPLIDTKEMSHIAIEAEYAALIPGTSSAVGDDGAVYIDDFEGTQTPMTLKTQYSWKLASTPQGQNDWKEGELLNDVAYGYNRAKLAWYIIDPILQRSNSTTPSHLRSNPDEQSSHYSREIYQEEIYPEKQTAIGEATNVPTLDFAYYPSEKGPYNFDTAPSSYSSGINDDGTLNNPISRWAGVMRQIETSDFESANIEFIEFWVMDPFLEDTFDTHEGGDLVFHLGNISEDILRDSRKSFENGLPEDANYTDITDNTVWGRVSRNQALVNAFGNSSSARVSQDIGLNGLNSEDERVTYSDYLQNLQQILTGEAYSQEVDDPANDDFHYYRGSDYDDQELGIVERYKEFNGSEGNSPTSDQSEESYSTSATSIPDSEDINTDNTLSETESYYEYVVSLRREDLVVGDNYISDKQTATVKLKNGESSEVVWYQFKVPIKQPTETVGTISDYRSIRFMRMIMDNWTEDVVLRFASLDLVRSDWRKYENDLSEDQMSNGVNTDFNISSVNIEENANRSPVNYILPPEIDRVIDPSNPQIQELNEQSMTLEVTDLEDGDARAAYKSTLTDMRRYKTLKMEVHAEEMEVNSLEDGELTIFLRLGSDYQYNYYEYEVPLKLTPYGSYVDTEENRFVVWPDENRMEIDLSVFTDLKLARNADMRNSTQDVTLNDVYMGYDTNSYTGQNIVKVKGNPNLAEVEVMMVGIRNPENDDSQPKSVEVWINELRLTDVDSDGGWAANVRVSGNLADLATYSFAGSKSTPGFGSIDQNVTSRSQETAETLDFSTNIELGRFFPEKWGVKIPMYLGISKEVYTPEYNPLDPDVTMEETLKSMESDSARTALENQVEDFTLRRSLNFTNVRIDRPNSSGKSHFYDISNFSLTYSRNTTTHRDINTETDDEVETRFLFNYNFTSKPKVVEPFRKVKAFQKPYLRLLRDFNFYYAPTQVSFQSDMNSYYGELKYRNITNPDFAIASSYVQDFVWSRYYNVKYNLTKGLKMDFNAQNTSRIDIPIWEEISEEERKLSSPYDSYKEAIMDSLLTGGRNIGYHQTLNLSYVLPINKIPALNWTSATARYQGSYDWESGPVTEDDEYNLGNSVQNSNTIQLNGALNFTNLYNKSNYLKGVNSKFRTSSRSSARGRSSSRSRSRRQKTETVTYDTELSLKARKSTKVKHKLNSEKIKIEVKNEEGELITGRMKVINANKISFTPSRSVKNAVVTITGEVLPNQVKEEKPSFTDYSSRFLMMVRNLNVTYSENKGTAMSGFLPTTQYLGTTNEYGVTAPGWGFVFGAQDPDFALKAMDNDWITTDSILNAPFLMSSNNVLNVRASIEPFKNLKIDLTGSRTFSENRSEYYFYDYVSDDWDRTAFNQSFSGSFSMSVNTWGTAFSSIGEEGVPASEAYEDFKNNRVVIANRLASGRIENPEIGFNPADPHSEDSGYPDGYGPTSSEVLIPAFFAAYTNQDPSKVSLSTFPSAKYMRPNWRIKYTALTEKVSFLKDVMKNVSINHAYTSTYNVGSYLTNQNFMQGEDGFSYIRDYQNNFVPQFDVSTVSINESFSPLVNVDVTWLNNLTTSFEYRKSRNLTLSMANNQLSENLSNEFSIGAGYRIEDLQIFYNNKSGQKSFSNDLNVSCDVGVRQNKTVLRKIEEDDNQLTAGQKSIDIRFTADYTLSESFMIQMYYDRTVNEPFVSLSYPTTNTNFGFSLRFTLNQ